MKGSDKLAIVGIGEAPTGWFPERAALDVILEVSRQAIFDAGIDKNDIGAFLLVPPLAAEWLEYHLTFGRLVEELGLRGCNFTIQVNSGGSSSSASLEAARGLITSGAAKAVLVAHTQKWSALTTEEMVRFFQENAGQYEEWEFMYGMTYNSMLAMVAERYMLETGTKPEHIAAVAVSLRKWAELNPNARFRKPLTIEEVLGSKIVTSPLHQLECNVLSDGGEAFIVTSAEIAKSITKTPVYLLGEGHGGVTHFSMVQKPDKNLTYWRFDIASKIALEEAGLKLEDMDIAEIYAAYPHITLMVLEELGFCKRGEAGQFVLEGNTWPGGKLPMSTNGEALSQGHTGAGVGMAMMVESVRQLMGKAGERQVKNAEFLIETAGGGAYMDSHVAIMGREIP